jgi:hypothetical protein
VSRGLPMPVCADDGFRELLRDPPACQKAGALRHATGTFLQVDAGRRSVSDRDAGRYGSISAGRNLLAQSILNRIMVEAGITVVRGQETGMRSVLSRSASALLLPGPPAPHTCIHDTVATPHSSAFAPRRSHQWDTASHFGLPQAPSGVAISPTRAGKAPMLSPSCAGLATAVVDRDLGCVAAGNSRLTWAGIMPPYTLVTDGRTPGEVSATAVLDHVPGSVVRLSIS